jgi:sRNA-binding regulator protein Hfq
METEESALQTHNAENTAVTLGKRTVYRFDCFVYLLTSERQLQALLKHAIHMPLAINICKCTLHLPQVPEGMDVPCAV